eukprot:CAMPEP_0118897394 /NCGR_PEP_ID=MMETSP1166-20130328/4807_1 /TAXON_ID=1104430 /ORGANISM="Chrysoreinhardia sp, Strain CCMP3193" /LENGTH=1271 /DNA_ID=CAMNT_0006836463 /DNA_START=64 /DNA_END=3879 /DNA_ORIENTATION=-
MLLLLLVLPLRESSAQLSSRRPPRKRETFCATGHPASTGDYDICCAQSCGVCAEAQCRERPGGPLNCCPLSGILASRETCRARRDESCALRRPSSEASHVFRRFVKGNATSGDGPVHVAISGDHLHYVGIVAAANSVFSTTRTPERIRLHVIAEQGPELDSLRSALECSLGESRSLDALDDDDDDDAVPDGGGGGGGHKEEEEQEEEPKGRGLVRVLSEEATADAANNQTTTSTTTSSSTTTLLTTTTAMAAATTTTGPPSEEEEERQKKKLLWWEIVLFEAKRHMPSNLTIVAPNNEQKGNLAADLNYARFYLPDLLPDVDKIIYMDADTIANKDVCKLFDTALVEEEVEEENQGGGGGATTARDDDDDDDGDQEGGARALTNNSNNNNNNGTTTKPSSSWLPVIAAVSREFKSVCFSLIYCDEPRVRDFLALQGVADPERDLNFFNAGVIVFHLRRWKARGLTEKAEFWMRANAELSIYSLGSNPPLLLAVGTHFEAIDPKWNCDGFGFKRPTAVTHECQVDAGIRHWSGHLKPWRRDGKYKMLWYPYISDLNCLLLLNHAPLKYAPPLELPPRQRAVSPGPNSLPLPSVDRLPLDLVLKLQEQQQQNEDQNSGEGANAAAAARPPPPVVGGEGEKNRDQQQQQQPVTMMVASKTTTTTTTTSTVAAAALPQKHTTPEQKDDDASSSSSSQTRTSSTVSTLVKEASTKKDLANNKKKKLTPTSSSSSGGSSNNNNNNNKKWGTTTTTTSSSGRSSRSSTSGTTTTTKKKLASREKAASLSGDTAQHRSREAFGLRAVFDEMQRSLNQYSSSKKPKAVKLFIEQLRSHPSVKWAPKVREAKLKNQKIPCGRVDHVLVIVHNNSLYVDSRQYGPRSPCGPRPPDNAMATFKFLHSFLAKQNTKERKPLVTFPDTIFLLCVDPRGTTYADVPVFTYGKSAGYEAPGILVPNPHFGRNHVKRWDRIAKQFEEASQRHPWDDRLPRVLWRAPFATSAGVDPPPPGSSESALTARQQQQQQASSSSSSSISKEEDNEDVLQRGGGAAIHAAKDLCGDEANVARLDAVSLTRSLPTFFDMRVAEGVRDAPLVFSRRCPPPATTNGDVASFLEQAAGLTDDNQHDDPALRSLFTAKWTGRISSMANKYVASLPDAGGAPPPSRNEIWLLGSAVLLWRSQATEWYYPALIEGATHITIDKHNAIDVVNELVADDNRAQRLAFEANAVFDNHLCAFCIIEYWVELIEKYNRRFGLRDVNIPAIINDLDSRRRLTRVFSN